MASGTLYLSSPLPVEKGDGLIKGLEGKVRELGQTSLRESSITVLVQALRECNVNTMWIQEESELSGWETRPEQVEEVMIGDVEYEVRKVLAVTGPWDIVDQCLSLLSGETASSSSMERWSQLHSTTISNGVRSFEKCTKLSVIAQLPRSWEL